MTNSSDLIKNTIWYQMKQIKTDWFYGTLLIDKNNKNEKRYRLLITIVFGVIGLLIDIDICKYLDKLTPLAGPIMGWLISGAKESRPCFLKDTETLEQIKSINAHNLKDYTDIEKHIKDNIEKLKTDIEKLK